MRPLPASSGSPLVPFLDLLANLLAAAGMASSTWRFVLVSGVDKATRASFPSALVDDARQVLCGHVRTPIFNRSATGAMRASNSNTCQRGFSAWGSLVRRHLLRVSNGAFP